MAEQNTLNTLNTRIKLKYDSYENWLTNDPVLYSGEVAIATIDSTENNLNGTKFQNLPNVVIKVGNGTAKYSELKFVSGLAADVYAWAKTDLETFHNAEREWIHNDTAHTEWLKGFVAGEIQDTDTRYKLVTEETAPYVIKLMATDPDKSDLTYDTLVASIDLTSLDTRLKTVEAALGEGGSVAQQISGAIEAIKLATPLTAGAGKVFDTISQTGGVVSATVRDLAIADVAGLQDALDACQEDLPIDGTPSEENKVATQATVTNAVKGLNNADAAVAKQFVTAVKETEGVVEVSRRALEAADIPMIEQSQVNGLETALAGKQEKLAFDGEYNAESNPVATKASVAAAVANLEGAMHFRGKVVGDTIAAAIAASDIKDWAAGDVVLWGDYEYVFDGNDWLELGNTALYQLKSDAQSQHEALQGAIEGLASSKQDVVPFEYTPSDEDKAATVKSIDERIEANNEGLKYEGGDAAAHKFVTKVTQSAGAVTAEYAQPAVADIAGLPDEIARVEGEIAKKQDILPIDGTASEENKVATMASVTGAIDALNKQDTAVAGQFVTAVTEEKGIVTVTRGDITTDHIKQGALTLVFDCGTSAI